MMKLMSGFLPRLRLQGYMLPRLERFGLKRANTGLTSLQERGFARMTMIDLYRILGVKRDSTKEEIDRKYARIIGNFDPERFGGDETLRKQVAEDQNLKIYFEDLTIAYKTLANEETRAEYDQYLSQHEGVSNYDRWIENHGFWDEVSEEELANRERKRRERMKQR